MCEEPPQAGMSSSVITCLISQFKSSHVSELKLPQDPPIILKEVVTDPGSDNITNTESAYNFGSLIGYLYHTLKIIAKVHW